MSLNTLYDDNCYLAGLYVGPEQLVASVVVVDAAGSGGVGHEPDVAALRRHAPHGVVVREEQRHGGVVGRHALRALHQAVAGHAGTLVRAVRVLAQLVTEAPLLALVPVCNTRNISS